MKTDQGQVSSFMRLFREEQQKYLQSSQNNATYHLMNPDTDLTYQAVNLFSSDKRFIYFISDVPDCTWSNQLKTVYTILVKLNILNTCGRMICSYFWITFLIFFWIFRMLFIHLAKNYKWTYQADPLLKNECKTCSPGTQFFRWSSITLWSTRSCRISTLLFINRLIFRHHGHSKYPVSWI